MLKWSIALAIAAVLGGCDEVGDAGPPPCDPFDARAAKLEYVAETDDGRLIVVTSPEEGGDYDDFRVYFGPPNAIDERIVHSVVRQLDGGTTTIELELDGAPVTAYFPAESRDLPWTLTIAAEELALARLAEVPDDVEYHCMLP